MIGEQDLKENWELLVQIISDRFADGDRLDLDSIIYLIGVQEYLWGFLKAVCEF